jgi:hypothetical protein
MPKPLDRPKFCPICGTNAIEPMLREVLLSAYLDGLAYGSSGVIAYHCTDGHIFLVFGNSFEWGNAVPDGNGYSMLV